MTTLGERLSPMEDQYLGIMEKILYTGTDVPDRTGTGTREIFGPQLHCDLADGFPILTTKEVRWRKAFAELAWMIHGKTNVRDLNALGVGYWDDWADPETGELGPVYGAQWRSWPSIGDHGCVTGGIDQLSQAVETLKTNPHSRRIIVSAWNPSQLDEMRLPPCHLYYQFNVAGGRLNLMMVQRSADWFLGVPFNICQYAALCHIVARLTDLKPGELIMNFGSAHLYRNHLEQAKEQRSREPHPMPQLKFVDEVEVDEATAKVFDLPEVKLLPLHSLRQFTHKHLVIENYEHHPAIKAPISV